MSYKFEEGEQVFVTVGDYNGTQGIVCERGDGYLVQLYNADNTKVTFNADQLKSVWPDTDLGRAQRQAALYMYQASKITESLPKANNDKIKTAVATARDEGVSEETLLKIVREAYEA